MISSVRRLCVLRRLRPTLIAPKLLSSLSLWLKKIPYTLEFTTSESRVNNQKTLITKRLYRILWLFFTLILYYTSILFGDCR